MMRTLKLAAFVASVAVLSLGVAGCGQSEQETPSGETETAMTTPGGEAAPLATGVGTDRGQTPPPFTLPDLEGNEVSLSDFTGKVVILDLWATWCPPCRKEIPFLVTLYDEYRDQGLEIVGVGLDRGGASVLQPFVDANDVNYTILVGGDEISRAYGVSGIPMTLMIGRDGTVASKEVGFAPSMEEGMRAKVVELLGQAAVAS